MVADLGEMYRQAVVGAVVCVFSRLGRVKQVPSSGDVMCDCGS